MRSSSYGEASFLRGIKLRSFKRICFPKGLNLLLEVLRVAVLLADAYFAIPIAGLKRSYDRALVMRYLAV